MSETFRVGVTRDFIRPNGELGFGGAGVRLLEHQETLVAGVAPTIQRYLTGSISR